MEEFTTNNNNMPPKIFIFLKTPKIIEFQNFEPPPPKKKKNDPSLCLYENIGVPPPLGDARVNLKVKILSLLLTPSTLKHTLAKRICCEMHKHHRKGSREHPRIYGSHMGHPYGTHMESATGLHMGPIWDIPFGVVQMGPIWVPHNSPIKKKKK